MFPKGLVSLVGTKKGADSTQNVPLRVNFLPTLPKDGTKFAKDFFVVLMERISALLGQSQIDDGFYEDDVYSELLNYKSV